MVAFVTNAFPPRGLSVSLSGRAAVPWHARAVGSSSVIRLNWRSFVSRRAMIDLLESYEFYD